MKNLFRKLLCSPSLEKGPAFSPASSKTGWVETTSDYTFHPIVQDTSDQRSKWTQTTYTSTDTVLTARKCKNCEFVTKIVRKVSDRKSDTIDSGCSLQFIQQATESGFHQHVISVQVGHMMGEWDRKGYTKPQQYGDQVTCRYSRYLGTLKCGGCKKYKSHYFLTVLLNDNEKSGRAKYYVTVGDVPASGDKAAAANSSMTEKLLATDMENEPSVSTTFTII